MVLVAGKLHTRGCLNNGLSVAAEKHIHLTAVPGPELLTGSYHSTAFTIPDKHTAIRHYDLLLLSHSSAFVHFIKIDVFDLPLGMFATAHFCFITESVHKKRTGIFVEEKINVFTRFGTFNQI